MCGGGGQHVWQGGMHGKGEVCVAGAMHGREACMVGACMAGGMHAMHAPLTLQDMVGQCVGGTHPTGMHSCCENIIT